MRSVVVETVARLKPNTVTVEGKRIESYKFDSYCKRMKKAISEGSSIAVVYYEFNSRVPVGRVLDCFIDNRGFVLVSRVDERFPDLRHFITGGVRVLPKFSYDYERVELIGTAQKDLERDRLNSFKVLNG